MGPLARLPVFFALEGKRAVVAGGSAAAAWKAELLSAAGAAVEVYAKDASEEMVQVISDPPRGRIVLHRRDWRPDDLGSTVIAVGAFEDEQSAGVFAHAARARGVAVNVIDKPAFCDFAFGAIVNRSPLVIGITTDGAAPVFAQAIRAKLEGLLPKGFAQWAGVAAGWRKAVKASGLPFVGRRKFWQLFAARAMMYPNAAPGNDDFVALLNEARGLGAAVERGSVTLVGAGPGDPELLTLRAVRALQSADVILFDDLVSRDVLDFARREAKKLLVGKTGHGPSCKQDDINALMVGLAKQGKRVVRLKGGDPMIFARAGEEIAACQAAGIVVDVVPGITAAQAAASRLGISLTGRGEVRRLQYITGHARDGQLPSDIDWRGVADPATTTAVYMPAKTLLALVAKGIAHGLDPLTPAVAVARATFPDEVVIRATIAALPKRIEAAANPGPILVLIGRACAKLSVGSQSAIQRHAIAAG
jgi:uroporphyrin-III C-methyltransferase/precorrin-2 dehydrogenase/sirohydrochlorin ferrochelatase